MAEKIETINQFLQDNFGIDTDDSLPIWRVVWSDDQYEKRLTKHTDSGIELITPEVRELPKYPHIKGLYVLERRVIVPEVSMPELPAVKKSYEPIWVFVGVNQLPVPPTIVACKFVIDTLHAALGKKSMAKYVDPDAGLSTEEQIAKNEIRLKELEDKLFGDESGLKQSTINASGNAIIMPSNYDKIVH